MRVMGIFKTINAEFYDVGKY